MVAVPKDDKLRFELVLKVSSTSFVVDGSCVLTRRPKPAREVST